MTIARTPDGNLELLEFIPCDAPIIPATHAHIPLTFSMVVVKHQNQYLILYNPERKQWEIPGGGINLGETIVECAIRELQEETSQVVIEVICKGIFKIRLHQHKYELGILFTAEVDELRPFIPNEEAERIMLWDLGSALDGEMSILSRALMDFC